MGSSGIRTITPLPVTFTSVRTLPAITLAPVTLPAVTLAPTTLRANTITVTSTLRQAPPRQGYLPPAATRFVTNTVTRSLPPVTHTVTKCGYDYPEPSRN